MSTTSENIIAKTASSEVAQPIAPLARRPAWPAQSDAAAFFGRIVLGPDGEPTERWKDSMLVTVDLPYPMRLSWDHNVTVRKFTCHKAVSRDLLAILGEIKRHYGSFEAIREARMDLYGGCYNFRRARGLAILSMHSYGIAIDLDPESNPLGKPWKKDSGMMPEAVIDIFAAHGWTWGGTWKRADAMHFQAAKA